MIIRGLSSRDIDQLRKIHNDNYSSEFDLSEFDTPNYLGRFSIIENDKIICAGGVRTLTEAIIVTNKDSPVKIRREALIKVLQASKYISHNSGHSSLHAFIQDEVWLQALLKHEFRRTKGTAILTDVDI